MDLGIAAAGIGVGLIIGLTGMGGGALMTPVLVLLFGIDPSAAISSDVVASVVLKPIGGGVHLRRGAVNLRLVRWLVAGSVPSAFLGAWLVSHLGGADVEDRLRQMLGAVLLVAATAIVAKALVQHRRGHAAPTEPMGSTGVRPLPTFVIGTVGGLVVGMTSVGSGSLMIVMLMLLYPRLSGREMVGTDLVQAVPLVASAALGHLAFGHVGFALTGSVLLGAIPGVYVGAHLSARGEDRIIRPLLVTVLAISALKLLGVGNGAVLVAITAAAGAFLATLAARRYSRSRASITTDSITSPTAVACATSTPSTT